MVKAKENERSQSEKNTNSIDSVSDGNSVQTQIDKTVKSVDSFIHKMLIECK